MKKEIIKKNIGLWMDHAEALIIDPEAGMENVIKIHAASAAPAHISGEESGTRLGNFRSTNNEAHIHNKEQNETHAYFHQLEKALQPYDEIFIFGPTTAGSEFHNYILKDKKLHGKNISVGKSDYLTENQIIEQVKKHFK